MANLISHIKSAVNLSKYPYVYRDILRFWNKIFSLNSFCVNKTKGAIYNNYSGKDAAILKRGGIRPNKFFFVPLSVAVQAPPR